MRKTLAAAHVVSRESIKIPAASALVADVSTYAPLPGAPGICARYFFNGLVIPDWVAKHPRKCGTGPPKRAIFSPAPHFAPRKNYCLVGFKRKVSTTMSPRGALPSGRGFLYLGNCGVIRKAGKNARPQWHEGSSALGMWFGAICHIGSILRHLYFPKANIKPTKMRL